MITPQSSLPVCRDLPRFFAIAALSAMGALTVGNSQAVLIEFTSAEGYANGTLNGQPSGTPVWVVGSSDASTPYSVNASGAGSVDFNTALDNRIAGYNSATNFSTGVAYTTSIDFTFVQSNATAAGSTTLAGLIYADNVSTGSINTTSAGFGRTTATDGYRLAFALGSVNIAGTALGINSSTGDTTSDVIRLTYTLQQGASASTWIGTETIFNVTTNTVVATRSSSAINIAASDPTSFFGAMQLGASMTTSGLSSFTVLSYNSPVAVPEPAVLSLLGVCAFAGAMSRRRRMA